MNSIMGKKWYDLYPTLNDYESVYKVNNFDTDIASLNSNVFI